eukprot:11476040-Ditylum_brightwellii.AAC.1
MVNINSNAIMALVQYQGDTTAAVRKIMKSVVSDKLEENYMLWQMPMQAQRGSQKCNMYANRHEAPFSKDMITPP